MRIALDISCLATNGRGFARYVQVLLKGFSDALPAGDSLLLYTDRPVPPSLVPPRFHPAIRTLPPRRLHTLWRRRDLVRAARADGADLLHFPDNEVAHCAPLPAVVTLHDISRLLMPERGLATLPMRLYFRRVVADIRKQAAAVIADSQAAAQDLSRYWEGRHPPVRIVPCGVAPWTGSETTPLSGTPYFLFVGALDQRKNLGTLAQGFTRFKSATGLPHELLLAGEKPRGPGVVVERLPVVNGVRLLGRIPDADLPGLYRGATALAMVSWYEAFGFPWLEAMAYDCPVLGTTAGSGPEIIGDAGLLADPADPQAIAAALTRLATEPELRKDLIRRGRERLKRFTIEAMAEGTLAVYRDVLKGQV